MARNRPHQHHPERQIRATLQDIHTTTTILLSHVRNKWQRWNHTRQPSRLETRLMHQAKRIDRSRAREAAIEFMRQNPPAEPIEAWVDRLLDVVDSATIATSTKRPKTLMEVFDEEDWLRGSSGSGVGGV